MSEIDTNLLYYSELLHLTRRRFEILEQICAAPDVLTAVLREINIRKSFKKQYLKVQCSLNFPSNPFSSSALLWAGSSARC